MSGYSRTFALQDGREVEVCIASPVPSERSIGDWECCYQIRGLGHEKKKVAVGIDSIQAIYLALQYIATALYFSDEFERGQLSWKGGTTPSDLGLPVVETVRVDVESKRAHVDALFPKPKPD